MSFFPVSFREMSKFTWFINQQEEMDLMIF